MSFMKDQVDDRKVDIQQSSNQDAFSLLVKANESETEKYKLSDDELVRPIPSHPMLSYALLPSELAV